MLTRLKVSGFKNLVDLDVRFGPFTCVAGPNGVGKSNLFDAIRFLSNLATMTLAEAALSVRDEDARSTDIRSLFHRTGGRYDRELSLEAEMLLPREAMDDLGQKAPATMTFARYRLVLEFREDSGRAGGPGLEIRHEELTHIPKGTAPRNLPFARGKSRWRDSVLHGQRRYSHFISTEGAVIRLHQDGGSRGRQVPFPAPSLPRTVLSSTTAENPTALVVRREMESWRLLQLEPSAMRKPDAFNGPDEMGADGSHLAATLYRLGRGERQERGNGHDDIESRVHGQIANRLSELVEDVAELRVDRDERRELLTVNVQMRDGTEHPARALSDGTLRFLALSVLELDPQCRGLLCLEEPENGIHPERIPAMLSLLRDIATDTDEQVGDDNPLRQVIVNTHSPAVVSQVPEDSLLVAESKQTVVEGERFDRLSCTCLPGTWRAGEYNGGAVSLGKLLTYLNPVLPENEEVGQGRPGASRVIDRPDVQMLLPFDGHDG